MSLVKGTINKVKRQATDSFAISIRDNRLKSRLLKEIFPSIKERQTT